MSAVPLRQQRPMPRPSATPHPTAASQRHLRAVAAPQQARSLASLAWTCIVLMVASMAAVLLISTAMTEGAYERRDLRIELSQLQQQRSTLVSQLEAKASPRFLADSAAALGMEPASTLGFISIERAAVLEQGGQ